MCLVALSNEEAIVAKWRERQSVIGVQGGREWVDHAHIWASIQKWSF